MERVAMKVMTRCAGLLLVGLAVGCRTRIGPDAAEVAPLRDPVVWPAPPATARLMHVKNVKGGRDLGVELSWWRKMANFITGMNKGEETFVRPAGVAVDSTGHLAFADPGAGALAFFNVDEKKFRWWERIGPYTLRSPVAVAVNAQRLAVADSVLGCVVICDHRGKFKAVASKPLQRPTGVAFLGDLVVVVDSQAHRVNVFNMEGVFVLGFGERGEGPGQFNYPTHVGVDNQGLLYVTDSMNHRVQVFDVEGSYKGVIGTMGNSPGQFSRPKGVSVDRLGHIYVVDAMFDNVQVFDSSGALLIAVGGAGSAKGQFWLPAGIAAGPDNHIYIADVYNRRIQVLKYLED